MEQVSQFFSKLLRWTVPWQRYRRYSYLVSIDDELRWFFLHSECGRGFDLIKFDIFVDLLNQP